MKNNITQFSLILIAFVAVNLLMSFARPMAADESKKYIVISGGAIGTRTEKFEQDINEKLADGWHLQGGICRTENVYTQAMVK